MSCTKNGAIFWPTLYSLIRRKFTWLEFVELQLVVEDIVRYVVRSTQPSTGLIVRKDRLEGKLGLYLVIYGPKIDCQNNNASSFTVGRSGVNVTPVRRRGRERRRRR